MLFAHTHTRWFIFASVIAGQGGFGVPRVSIRMVLILRDKNAADLPPS